MTSKPKRPRDASQRAKLIVDIATGEAEEDIDETKEESEAAKLGRKGGLKGGKARWANLAPEERSEAASLAAQARWRKKRS